ncbi:MAG: hypothetical protein U0263_40860 [Polyangiaceae bacterium]
MKVETVGLQTLTVKATGSKVADAVARKVLVVPDGKELSDAISGSLAGNVKHDVSFPANAVPGSQELYLQVFPAFLSQVVTGMDSMLQVPNGCFEQTTSTAWPSVLVTPHDPNRADRTPEIQLSRPKAFCLRGISVCSPSSTRAAAALGSATGRRLISPSRRSA